MSQKPSPRLASLTGGPGALARSILPLRPATAVNGDAAPVAAGADPGHNTSLDGSLLPSDAHKVEGSSRIAFAAAPSAEREPFHIVDESPRWLLFPQPNAEQRHAYQPRALDLPATDRDEPPVGAMSRRDVFEVLRRVRLFKDITNAELEELMSLGKVIAYPRYSILVREGTLGSTAFVCLSGQLVTFSSKATAHSGPATTDAQRLQAGATLGPASIFGEAGLVEDVVRDYAVSAVSTCRMWTIERSALDPFEKHLRPPVMSRLESTAEWVALKQVVIEGLLSTLPFFGSLVPSRRQALAGLMTIAWYDTGSVLFREGDNATRFYIVSEGTVEIHKHGGKFSGSRVVSSIDVKSARPWFGEVALFMRKPRAGSALIVETARLLVVDEINFDPFLAMVPDFRPYLNKNHKQASAFKEKNKGMLTIEQSTAEEQKLQEQAQVAMKWQSGSMLGAKSKDDMAERSIFAERWERLVTSLLYMSNRQAGGGGGGSNYNTVSFKTSDYIWQPPKTGTKW